MKISFILRLLFLISLYLLFANEGIYGQYSIFLREGSIEYERKFNQHSILDPNQSWGRNSIESESKFRTESFTLDFNQSFSIYRPTVEIVSPKSFYLSLPAQENLVYKDHEKRTSLIKRKIFESENLIRQNLNFIQWKITSETRLIAGFECKRANAVIFDSVYVIAYYCEQMPISSGPESFSGLPGMILGLAIPDLLTTWFATKITSKSVLLNNPILTNRREIQTSSAFQNKLKDAFLNHGIYSFIFYTFAIL
ncbi:MAG: GLPGLI family protein [Sediminibacterium sp.]